MSHIIINNLFLFYKIYYLFKFIYLYIDSDYNEAKCEANIFLLIILCSILSSEVELKEIRKKS